MVKTFVTCQECGEIFIAQEVKEHQDETKHNSWALCYGASPMRTLWRWVLMSKEAYQTLSEENKALERKVKKQAEIIADSKNIPMKKAIMRGIE